MTPPPQRSTLFPYTTLFRSRRRGALGPHRIERVAVERDQFGACLDRKSTRLNSSHRTISYAVFCLKKKKTLVYTIPSTFLLLITTRSYLSRHHEVSGAHIET